MAVPQLIPQGLVPSVAVYSWWRLPSGKVVEIRRIVNDGPVKGRGVECVVRDVGEDGELAPGEYSLTLRFLCMHASPVRVAASKNGPP